MLIHLSIVPGIYSQDYIESDSILLEEYTVPDEWTPIEEDADVMPSQESPEFPASNETPVWNDEKWQEIKKKYNYEQDKKEEEEPKEEEEEQIIDDMNAEQTSSLMDAFNDFFMSPFGKIIAIILASSLLIFLIVKLFSGKSLSDDRKVIFQEENILNNPEELPAEDALDKLLRQALDRNDYKMSVRILYLILIRQLNESKYIQWQKDKTNRDYLNEMRINHGYRDFRELTLVYEVIWYGDKIINQSDYHTVAKLFTDYQKNLIGNNKEK